ncbi:MAG: dienelactone hydrolase family protein [Alphaproteobacteria bacterium]|nr:dienelactone hydrolase family protein [Alphaproteobacteria bacterium]
MATMESIPSGGVPMNIHVEMPQGGGPFPAVVLAFHRGGIDDFTKDRASRLADEGFIAAAPDLFHRMPADTENPLPLLNDKHIVEDIAATVDHLAGKAECNGRMAIAGHCMGGRISFLGAAVNPAFQAAVVYYSGNMFKTWGEGEQTPFELLSGIKGPVIGFFGNDDQNPSPDDVDKIDAELTRLGIEHQFHRYDGAGHAFQNFLSEAQYREDAEKDSWAKTLDFLKRVLR